MAVISKIREKIWIVLVLIGLALASFVLMDIVSQGRSGSMSTQYQMGKVAGEEIDYQEFSRTEQALYGNADKDVLGRRQYLWDFFVEKALVNREADKIGLGVSKAELLELQFGANLSPIIEARFTNPNTGMLDRQQLQAVKQAIESGNLQNEYRTFWSYQEKEILKDRLQSKISSLVSKAIYTPNWMAEMFFKDQSNQADVLFVKVPFESIPDSEAPVDDKDLRKYAEENKARYIEKEEKRRISFISFDAKPTPEDSAKLRTAITDLITPFREAQNDSIFVETNLGEYSPKYFDKKELTSAMADTFFKLPVRTVIGPYVEDGQYKLAKILDRKVVPDSVRSRHILIQVKDQASFAAVDKRIDSLKNLIETQGMRFDSLAMRFGQDGSASKGGDLGFKGKGQLVAPFENVIFFKAEPGKLYKVYTQFGIHLVEVTDRKFTTNTTGVKVAYLSEPIVPSEETQNTFFDKAQNLLTSNRKLADLQKAGEKNPELQLIPLQPIGPNDYNLGVLGSGPAQREIVKWAFDKKTETGDVSSEVFRIDDEKFNYTRKFVVAALEGIQPKNKIDVDALRSVLTPIVKNLKKGEKIAAKITAKDLASVASQFATKIDTAQAVSFGSSFVPAIGFEPKVLGAVAVLKEGAVSKPIVGTNGVYVIQIKSRKGDAAPADMASFKKITMATIKQQAANLLMNGWVKSENIRDNRSRFY